MYIRINKEKIKFISILNGEPVLLKIENKLSNDTEMLISTSVFAESDYIIDSQKAKRGYIQGFNSTFTFNTIESKSKHYNTIAIKLIKEKIKNDLGLSDNDMGILAEAEWRHEAQIIRLTIPIEEVIDNTYYRELMDELIIAGVIKYKVGDYYILYLSYINTEHRIILEADENILIEE